MSEGPRVKCPHCGAEAILAGDYYSFICYKCKNRVNTLEATTQRPRSSSSAPWERKYYQHPCPHCGQYKVRDATWDDKRFSIAFWGAASSKIGKRYKCDHCGNMW